MDRVDYHIHICVWKDVALTEEEIKVIYSHGKKR